MGAILNGLALHGGFRPFGGTFLVFSDYMRPPIRLAALGKLPVVFVFTHDSIGLGEDGPTHQPVEHLAALRAMPGLTVLRPADAVETAAAWVTALEDGTPTAIALTRQDVAPIDRPRDVVFEGVRRGAYVVRPEAGGPPDVVIVGTGSEVGVALDAGALLAAEGVRARVVSMPSVCRFTRAGVADQEAVLPRGVPRVVVEAAVSFGWHRIAGDAGAIVGIDHFGASAPASRLFQEFGITAANVASVARGVIARARKAT